MIPSHAKTLEQIRWKTIKNETNIRLKFWKSNKDNCVCGSISRFWFTLEVSAIGQ